ncbi:MAG: saccharopine dehydrogenase NADP-binding domain-containing protein [Cyclobacteriaceae bacterium]|nr:saccharopine dehydrogenase NADP-binding domain-containing protein [Cyclobacteriaceae bacterium]
MVQENVFIYGAYGYTGKLIVDLAVKKGHRPVLGGRDEEKVKVIANQYGLQWYAFDCNNQEAWDTALNGKQLLLNCAGPFSLTIRDILPACLRNKVHYLDITGEIDVFEYISRFDKEAKKAGITLLPGTGFDVVPTDCLAVFLKEQLPDATHLELAFDSQSGLSRGTALSVLNRFHQGSAVRKEGVIVPSKTASVSKIIKYGGQERLSVGIAWGDVFTAFYSTGIPNIEVYTGMPPKMLKAMKKASKFGWLIKTWLLQIILKRIVRKKIDGPSINKRETLRTYLWGKVMNAEGKEVVAELETPESYKLTAITALLCAEGVLEGKVKSGYTTPAKAFGADFILRAGGSRKIK